MPKCISVSVSSRKVSAAYQTSCAFFDSCSLGFVNVDMVECFHPWPVGMSKYCTTPKGISQPEVGNEIESKARTLGVFCPFWSKFFVSEYVFECQTPSGSVSLFRIRRLLRESIEFWRTELSVKVYKE